MIHLWPDHWIAGSLDYQIQWSRQWIKGHAEEAALLRKPLVIGEFGKIRPLADRNTFFKAVYQEAANYDDIAGTNCRAWCFCLSVCRSVSWSVCLLVRDMALVLCVTVSMRAVSVGAEEGGCSVRLPTQARAWG
jgi:hypothetical protein